jgi:hypothetical protein
MTDQIKYEDVDALDKSQLSAILGDKVKPGMSVAKMRAMVKSAIVAAEIEEDSGEDLPEQAEELPTPAVAQSGDTITISKSEMDGILARIRSLEATASLGDKAKIKEQRMNEKMASCRVSDHYRDVLTEYRLFREAEFTKRPQPQLVARDRRSEMIACGVSDKGQLAVSGSRLVPCAPNGGRYWLRNRNWHENPKSGEKRKVIPFNRHLYTKVTIKGGHERNTDYILCDVHGNEVQPFAASLPMENFDKGIPWKPRRARKADSDETNEILNRLIKLQMSQLKEGGHADG